MSEVINIVMHINSSGEGNGTPLQYSCLENSMDGGACWGSQRVGHDWATSLSLFTFMHWRRKWQPTPVFLPGEIPGTGKPGGLLSMGLHRVGHDWSNLAAAEPGNGSNDGSHTFCFFSFLISLFYLRLSKSSRLESSKNLAISADKACFPVVPI